MESKNKHQVPCAIPEFFLGILVPASQQKTVSSTVCWFESWRADHALAMWGDCSRSRPDTGKLTVGG